MFYKIFEIYEQTTSISGLEIVGWDAVDDSQCDWDMITDWAHHQTWPREVKCEGDGYHLVKIDGRNFWQQVRQHEQFDGGTYFGGPVPSLRDFAREYLQRHAFRVLTTNAQLNTPRESHALV